MPDISLPVAKNRNLNFFRLLKSESSFPFNQVMIFGIISGAANAILLSSVNSASDLTEDGAMTDMIPKFFVFMIALLLFFLTKRFILVKTTQFIEETVTMMRLRIIDKIRQADLELLEKLGQSEVFTQITSDTTFISNSASIIISAGQSAILIICCVIYIAFISMPAFIALTVVLVLGVLFYVIRQKSVFAEISQAREQEKEVFNTLENFLEGFKELKLSRKKNDDLYKIMSHVSLETQYTKAQTSYKDVVNVMFSQVIFYLLLGVMVFVLPKLDTGVTADITKLTAAILFIVGPINSLVGSITAFTGANVAIENLHKLEDAVADSGTDVWENPDLTSLLDFETLELRDLEFDYRDEEGQPLFTVGPFNMTFKRGENIFIKGGNGSGKSTFLKLFTGLYFPKRGRILVDGIEINRRNINAYRELFSAIFTDFHLFNQILGVDDFDPARIDELLRLMQLERKTSFSEGKFSSLKLSTGQRKRLALIQTILDDKPIFIFDEVAADQDPEFRKAFYTELLPKFISEGKTLFVVTHDDNYFQYCDRILQMKDGMFVKE